ncbi:SDR family oxidoreductase [candidate division KSB1 bacterium]|nr:SDR family oxidoreductase [candidate division KSB1 bacterium]
MIDLQNKTALVTGGSRGVGRAVAQLLARAGARVGITYRSRQQEAEQTLQIIRAEGSEGWAHQIDFSDESKMPDLFARLDREFPGGLDLFIANAGIWPPEDESIEQMEYQRWRHTLRVNLDSVFLATQEAGKRMRHSGRIVYVGSTAGQRGEAFHVDYAATKGAMISMVKGLCVEYAARDITVNCVAPGWIDTEMSNIPYADGGLERISKSIPLGRVASAEDVAGPIIFLCSHLARHITGEVLNINGGAILCG